MFWRFLHIFLDCFIAQRGGHSTMPPVYATASEDLSFFLENKSFKKRTDDNPSFKLPDSKNE